MKESKLDPRYPELFIKKVDPDCNNEKYNSIKNLGEEYRQLKKRLKDLIEQKKNLSRKVNNFKENTEEKETFIDQVKKTSESINSVKKSLKELEHEIISITAKVEKSTNPPPQFMKTPSVESNLKAANYTIKKLDDDYLTHWEQYVHNHPNATIYHSLPIKKVIESTFRHEYLYLMAININNEICGILPLFRLKSSLFGDIWCSIPFFNYGGVLADNKHIEKLLIEFASNIIVPLDSDYIELRQTHFFQSLSCKKEKVSMTLTLPNDVNKLWQNLGSKVRAQIQKAQKYSYQIEIGKDSLISDFYRVFSENMRDLGTPVYEKSLFINMLNNCPSANIVIIYINEKPVSAGFIVGWKNTLEIPWASTVREANKYNANMLLYWNILQYAISKKYENFDFGRSSKCSTTYQFKKQWGAKEHQLYWHYILSDNSPLPGINVKNPKYQLAILIWKLLPVWVTKLIGPNIVKYIP